MLEEVKHNRVRLTSDIQVNQEYRSDAAGTPNIQVEMTLLEFLDE